MRLQVKGKNVEVSEQIRAYAEEKLGKLERHLNGPTRVEVELAVERNPSIGANNVAEATVWTKGPVLRAREASTDMKASIDQLADKIERQVTRYQDKRRRRAPRAEQGQAIDVPGGLMTDEVGPNIVKTKQFAVKPMNAEEAILQLELVGHDFFVFRDDESNEVNVVYRRRDGGYGLIEPQ
jgi:putative sigma-54 modulation protein